MEKALLHDMAEDLGIIRYKDEEELSYSSRVVYSAVASWIKAISLDCPEGSAENNRSISKKHILDRSDAILQSILSIYPGLQEWFQTEGDEPAVNIIRSRLLGHGDLIDVGFDTNVSLCKKHDERINSDIVVKYGIILEKEVSYSGIATVVLNHDDEYVEKRTLSSLEWYQNYLKEIVWARMSTPLNNVQYYDPFRQSSNNYSLWQSIKPGEIGGIRLARMVLGTNRYEYYLFNNEKNMYHSIDPFLIEMGAHIRIMLVLRSYARNKIWAELQENDDNVKINLNCWLPTVERKLFEEYAWPVKNVNDGLTWLMSKDIWNMIKPKVEDLQIVIRRVNNG